MASINSTLDQSQNIQLDDFSEDFEMYVDTPSDNLESTQTCNATTDSAPPVLDIIKEPNHDVESDMFDVMDFDVNISHFQPSSVEKSSANHGNVNSTPCELTESDFDISDNFESTGHTLHHDSQTPSDGSHVVASSEDSASAIDRVEAKVIDLNDFMLTDYSEETTLVVQQAEVLNDTKKTDQEPIDETVFLKSEPIDSSETFIQAETFDQVTIQPEMACSLPDSSTSITESQGGKIDSINDQLNNVATPNQNKPTITRLAYNGPDVHNTINSAKSNIRVTPQSSSNTPASGGKPVANRFDLARQEQLKNEENRVNSLKNSRNTTTPSTSENFSVNEATTSLSEKRTLAILKTQKDKEERLKQFLATSVSPAGNIGSGSQNSTPESGQSDPSMRSIKDRFAMAKKDQQQKEEERLNRMRDMHTGKSTPTSSSVDGTKKESLKNRWQGAISDMKSNEQQRYLATRSATISAFRITDGTGYVKQKIGEWEELFMQIAASKEQIANAIQQAILKARRFADSYKEKLWRLQREQLDRERRLKAGNIDCSNNNHNQTYIESTCYSGSSTFEQDMRRHADEEEIRHINDLNPEVFVIGTVSIYNIKHLPSGAQASFLGLVQKQGSLMGGISLPVGIYGDQDSQSMKPVQIVAVLMESEDNEKFLAITIEASEGFENDPKCFGVIKVAVFADVKDAEPAFIREFDVVAEAPEPQYSANSDSNHIQDSVMNLNNEMEFEAEPNLSSDNQHSTETVNEKIPLDLAENERIIDSSIDKSEVAVESTIELQETPQDQHNESHAEPATPMKSADEVKLDENKEIEKSPLSPAEDGKETWRDKPTPVRLENEVSTGENGSVTKVADTDSEPMDFSNKAPFANSSNNADNFDTDPDIEEKNEENNVVFNFGRSTSVAAVSQRLFLPNQVGTSRDTKIRRPSQTGWTAEDERDDALPEANHNMLPVNILEIYGISSSFNCLVLQTRHGAIVITGTLKHTNVNSMFVVANDKLFEWYRGAATSGWLTKWPMKSQNIGFPSHRFFVLRDSLLSYHEDKPKSEVQAATNYALSSFRITEDTRIRRERRMFRHFINIENQLDSLWLRCAKDSIDDEKWAFELNRSIEQLKRKVIFPSKPRVEIIWHHESKGFSLVAVDAVAPVSSQRHLHVALFRYDVSSDLFNEVANSNKVNSVDSDDGGKKGGVAGFFGGRARRLSFAFLGGKGGKSGKGSVSEPVNNSNNSTNTVKMLDSLYSVDIGSSESDRIQLEVCDVIGNTALKTDLRCVKLCGETILLGGSNGFLGVGNVGKKSKYDKNGEPTDGNPITTGESCLFVTKVTTTVLHESEATRNSLGAKKAPNHSPTACISCIASAPELGLFVAGDTEGNISMWRLNPRNSNSLSTNTNTSSNNSDSTSTSNSTADVDSSKDNSPLAGTGIETMSGVHFLDFLNINAVGRNPKVRFEQIKSIQFMPNRELLLVGTNERLLMLSMNDKYLQYVPEKEIAEGFDELSKNYKDIKSDSVSVDDNTSNDTSKEKKTVKIDILASSGKGALSINRFSSFTELDRVFPGFHAIFSVSVSEEFKPLFVGSLTASIKRRLVVWKVVHEDTESQRIDDPECVAYRFEWNDDMLQTAMQNMKAIDRVE